VLFAVCFDDNSVTSGTILAVNGTTVRVLTTHSLATCIPQSIMSSLSKQTLYIACNMGTSAAISIQFDTNGAPVLVPFSAVTHAVICR
jgi:Ethanolamine utilization protein EutJ (predicted chaperonin)